MKNEHHSWTVDVIEEGSAAIEVDGRQITPIPRWMLPEAAKEGDVLAVTHERSRERSLLTIEIDREATREALRRSRKQVAENPSRGDKGGDVTL
jgi:hypothetical protein